MKMLLKVVQRLKIVWCRFWMMWAGLSVPGRLATRLAVLFMPPFYGRHVVAEFNPKGFIAPGAQIVARDFQSGRHIFIDDRVLVYQGWESGVVLLGDGVHIYRDTIIQTGNGGSVMIGAGTHIQPRCQFSAYKGSIKIGAGVQVAPNCAFYSYNHSFEQGRMMTEQPLQSKGGVVIGDDVWLGVGVTILDGVTLGNGAVVAAGAVVTHDVPANAIAAGVPAKVVAMRPQPERSDQSA